MRYSIQPKFRKYVKGNGFLLFARKCDDKYGKKFIDTATKTGTDAAKTALKRVVRKTAEATGDLIGNKIADKINSIGKTKCKECILLLKEISLIQKQMEEELLT